MDVFNLHSGIVADYKSYVSSFIRISADDIRKKVDAALEEGKLWPEPLLQLNPAFEDAGRIEELAEQGLMHPDCADIFKGYRLYRHQREAISRGLKEQSFVVTSGTGSGKSLTYIGTIFNQRRRHERGDPDVYPADEVLLDAGGQHFRLRPRLLQPWIVIRGRLVPTGSMM